MNVRTLMVTLALACAPAGAAHADDRGSPEQQRDCMNDAMTFCSQHILAPDRNDKIGLCLWQHRMQISRACFAHLRPPKRGIPLPN
jgi:hypothetical protein